MAHSMNKAELIEAMASGADISKADAKKALDSFINTTSNALKKGDRVALIGFGSFTSGRNPQTGKEIKFTPSKTMSNAAFMVFAKSYIDKATPLMMKALKNRGMNNDQTKMMAMLKTGLKNALKYRGNDPLLRKRPGRVKYSNVTLKRGQIVGKNVGQSTRLNSAHQKYLNTLIKGAMKSLFNFMEKIASQKGDVNLAGAKLTKKHILRAMEIGIDEDGLNRIYSSITSAFYSAFKKGDKVSIPGFGTFSISKRAARTGRNPQTGATIQIKAKKVVKFKAGKALADRVN